MGQDPYQVVIGTVGGYVSLYDVRYNIAVSHSKQNNRAPILSMATIHCPSTRSQLNFNRSDTHSPLLLISSGTTNYQVSLLNLATQDVEILLTVDDKRNKEGVLGSLP